MRYRLTIPPSTESIKGMINAESMTLKKAIAELISNALDQDATQIDITLDKKGLGEFVISDNGKGCPKLEDMVRIGCHISSKSNPIGRYGVGFKDAVIWMGDTVVVDSMIKAKRKQSVHGDWQNMIAVKDWDFVFDDKESNRDTHGVTISVGLLRGKRFRAWPQVPAYISELFSAAIDLGVQITVDGKTVKSIPQPLLLDQAPFEGTYGGLRFSGIAGILADDRAAIPGWEIRYGVQTICIGHNKDGFGDYSIQGFYGRFYMIDGEQRWHLSRNKTDSEDLATVLNSPPMQEIIKPILEKLKARRQNIHIKLNQKSVQETLSNILINARIRLNEEETELRWPERTKRPTTKTDVLNPDDVGDRPEKQQPPPQPKRMPDVDSEQKRRIKQAQKVDILAHNKPDTFGLFNVTVSRDGRFIKIYIDESTKIGQTLWLNHDLLLHYGVMTLAAYLGSKVNIIRQLRLPIGDVCSTDEQISKTLLFLLDHVDLKDFGVKKIAS
jgi:hypothetical protein